MPTRMDTQKTIAIVMIVVLSKVIIVLASVVILLASVVIVLASVVILLTILAFMAYVIERMFMLAPSSDPHLLVGINADLIRRPA